MEGATTVEYNVELGVDIDCPIGDGEFADALLTILERYEQADELAGPVALLVEPYDPDDPDLEPLRHPATTPTGNA